MDFLKRRTGKALKELCKEISDEILSPLDASASGLTLYITSQVMAVLVLPVNTCLNFLVDCDVYPETLVKLLKARGRNVSHVLPEMARQGLGHKVVSRNGVAFAQNNVKAFFVCSFPRERKMCIWRKPYSNENKGARDNKVQKPFIWEYEMQI